MTEIKLPFRVKRPILACGADMKGAFALAEGGRAFLVGGFGDLADPDNFERYAKAMKRLRPRPGTIACDLHPGYFSAAFAGRLAEAEGIRLVRVQHHEAHVASAIADNAVKGDVIGVAFDGTGYGADGNIWGGEFFIGNIRRLKRTAHLGYMPMPGGEAAVREPWRMAASYLYAAFGERFLKLKIDIVRDIKRRRWPILKVAMEKGINSPLTSSAGRLFDAAASIVLSKAAAAFEAELPIELEKSVSLDSGEPYCFDIRSEKGLLVVDCARTIKGIVKDLTRGEERGIVAAKFHNTVAEMIAKTAVRLRKGFGVNKVVLSGGVFQNIVLRRKAAGMLEREGFDLYLHSNVPANDGGIPLGQIAIAKARASCV